MSHFQFMAPSDGTCHHWHRRKRDAWLCVTHWSSWQHARARTHVSPINAPPMLLCNGTVSSAWFNQSIRIFDKFLCEFVWFMHVSEQCNFSKASVWQRVGFGASLGFSVWSPPPAISSKWPGTRGTWRSGRVALQSLEIAIDRTTHDDAPAADPEHCSLVQRPGIFEDFWGSKHQWANGLDMFRMYGKQCEQRIKRYKKNKEVLSVVDVIVEST